MAAGAPGPGADPSDGRVDLQTGWGVLVRERTPIQAIGAGRVVQYLVFGEGAERPYLVLLRSPALILWGSGFVCSCCKSFDGRHAFAWNRSG